MVSSSPSPSFDDKKAAAPPWSSPPEDDDDTCSERRWARCLRSLVASKRFDRTLNQSFGKVASSSRRSLSSKDTTRSKDRATMVHGCWSWHTNDSAPKKPPTDTVATAVRGATNPDAPEGPLRLLSRSIRVRCFCLCSRPPREPSMEGDRAASEYFDSSKPWRSWSSSCGTSIDATPSTMRHSLAAKSPSLARSRPLTKASSLATATHLETNLEETPLKRGS
mmetsp:Transcript_20052/g.64594  ORF Transcript_20052/g.64594 Transcript_20052/m.64594 type:complete len:222 (-) Transcript_20052:1217-1882(-)